MENDKSKYTLRARIGMGLIGISALMFVWTFFFVVLSYRGYIGGSWEDSIYLYSDAGWVAIFILIISSVIFLLGLYLIIIPTRETKVIYMGHQTQPPQP